MGYTHYWKLKAPIQGRTADTEARYQLALVDMRRVVAYWQEHAESECRLSGYSAHTGDRYGGLHINGKQKLAHEDLIFREHYKENKAFEFCKTAQKPYDTVVAACLLLLHMRLPDVTEISSDGTAKDWAAAQRLINDALGIAVLIPSTIKGD
jgi:hypothetical protein